MCFVLSIVWVGMMVWNFKFKRIIVSVNKKKEDIMYLYNDD